MSTHERNTYNIYLGNDKGQSKYLATVLADNFPEGCKRAIFGCGLDMLQYNDIDYSYNGIRLYNGDPNYNK